jgi:hypothetical protein
MSTGSQVAVGRVRCARVPELAAVLAAGLLCAAVASVGARPAGALVTADSSACFVAAQDIHLGPPRSDMLAIVNLTPVDARAPGFGLLVSPRLGRDVPPGSNVNFFPGSVDPNVGVAVTGSAGEVCFANSDHGDVELVADVQVLLRGGTYTATDAPFRRVDTRVGLGGGRLSPRETRCFGVDGMPGDMVFVNLTPVHASAPGFGLLTAEGNASSRPASNVNFGPGSVDPNVAAAQISIDRKVCFVNSEHASIDLIADQLFTLEAEYVTVMLPTPDRRLDTRLPGGRPIAPGERYCFSAYFDPGDIAVMNLTPVNATAPGFGVLVSSNVTETPLASSVNFRPGSVDPNVAFTPIGDDRSVCFINSDLASVDLVADLIMTIDRSAIDTRLAGRFDTRSPVIASVGCTPVSCAAITSGGSFVRSATPDGPWEHQRLVSSQGVLTGVSCTGVWCFFEEPNLSFSPATPFIYGRAWGFNDSSPVGADGWSAIHAVPRGAKACPTDKVCLSLSDYVGTYGLYMWPTVSITRDRGASWASIDLTTVDPPIESYQCTLSSDPGSSCTPRPPALFSAPTCSSVTECSAQYWAGGSVRFSTFDDWATVIVERLPLATGDP